MNSSLTLKCFACDSFERFYFKNDEVMYDKKGQGEFHCTRCGGSPTRAKACPKCYNQETWHQKIKGKYECLNCDDKYPAWKDRRCLSPLTYELNTYTRGPYEWIVWRCSRGDNGVVSIGVHSEPHTSYMPPEERPVYELSKQDVIDFLNWRFGDKIQLDIHERKLGYQVRPEFKQPGWRD